MPPSLARFVEAVSLFDQAKYPQALAIFESRALAATPLAAYARYYAGRAQLEQSRSAEARDAFAALRASSPTGYLAEASRLAEARAAEAQGDAAAAAKLYRQLSAMKTAYPDEVLLALARMQQAAGDRQGAAETYARLYYEFPLSDLATVAGTSLAELGPAPGEAAELFRLDLGRAERLFGGRRYGPARDAFAALRDRASGDDAELVALRLAECDHYLGRFGDARKGLQPFLDKASRKSEAQFFYLTATERLGQDDEYLSLVRALVDANPESSWAEEALNNLGSHYIIEDDDETADAVFRELLAKFPRGRHAERAAWKVGWFAYKNARYEETARVFEAAALAAPRSDYRPAFLYWAARAREHFGDRPASAALYQVTHADYAQSYYGRLALSRLDAAGVKLASLETKPGEATAAAPAPDAAEIDAPPPLPPTQDLIRLLLSLGLYNQAKDELLFAQRTWGDSAPVSATLAWVYNRQGDTRRGIVTMKRAYPQYLSSGAAALPDELLRIVYPLESWPIIKRYSVAHDLDPYVVSALINQESSFVADIKSSANAIGLMQILPSTGRHLARQLGIRRFSASSLTRPELNVRLGTLCFAATRRTARRPPLRPGELQRRSAPRDRVDRGAAGPRTRRVHRRHPVPRDAELREEILGTVENYRRLYGKTERAPRGRPAARPARRRRRR